MPAAKRKTSAKRTRKPASHWKLPQLDQRQLDLVGLGLIALGVFFAFLVYFGWDGGRAGSQAVEGLRWLLGAVHYVVPVALVAAGAILILRPILPAVRPFRSGAICLFAALTLGLAAGTLGVGPGGHRPQWWDPEWVKTRGGMTGEALDWVVATLTGRVGAHILAVLPFISGVLLLTGASVAGVIKATSDSVSTTIKKAPTPRRPAREYVTSSEVRAREDGGRNTFSRAGISETPPISEPPEFDVWDAPDEPEPEPEVVEQRLAEDPPEDEEGVTRAPVEPEQLTPQGRYRPEVTDSPDFIWQAPDPALLTRSTEDQSRPDTAGQEKVAAQLIEALAHFKIEARVIGMVAGPHITRYELRLAPGIKVGKVAQLKDDLAYALAASDVRILAPIPGKQAVGIEVPNARRRIVHLGAVFQPVPADWSPLTVWLGKDAAGRSIGTD